LPYTAASILLVVSLAGIALTVVTLPGAWLICGAAILIKMLWIPDLLSWWTIGVAVGLAIVGEIVELAASSFGAAKAGGSKRGAIGALVGTLAGAIIGSFILFFPIGTIVGAVAGAAAGSLVAERAWAGRTWAESAKASQGAAVGRLAATVMKTGFTVAIGLVVSIAGFMK